MLPPEEDEHDDCATANLQDVSSCEAYRVLDTLVEIGHISGTAGRDAKAQYERLHAALVAAMGDEKGLLERARQLARDAEASQASALEAQRKAAAFEGVSIEALREDMEAALAEASLAQERAALLGLEQEELGRQRDALAEHLDGVSEQHAAALAPVVAGLQSDATGLRADLDAQCVATSVAEHDLAALRARVDESEASLSQLQAEHKAEANHLLTVAKAPDKARRQADAAVAELAAAQAALAAAETRVQEADAAVRAAAGREREQQLAYTAARAGLERHRIMAESKERHADDVARDIELAGLERERILSEQADLELGVQALAAELRGAAQALSHARNDKLCALRSYKAAEVALAGTREELPPLRIARDLAAKDKAAEQVVLGRVGGGIAALRADVDGAMAALLEEEGVGKDRAELFGVLRKEVALLEGELAAAKEEDRQTQRLHADMAAQRDRAARRVAAARSKAEAARSAATLRERQEEDLRRAEAEAAQRARDFGQLHDMVRNQRNRFVALVAAAAQAKTEMGERTRLLASEAEILAASAAAKGQLLHKARAACAVVARDRDALQHELHGLGGAFKSKGDKLREQTEAIEALSGLISRTEGDMVATRRSYKEAVEARNNTGVMLIDRNDELAVLHEKVHMQQARIAAGTMELSLRDNEVRVLQLEVAELQRSLGATRASVPDVPAIDAEVAALKAELLKARQAAASLGAALEDPVSHPGRVRVLGGKAPGRDELAAKLQSLEERLAVATDALLSRGLVLEEAAALTEGLRSTAAKGRAVGCAAAAASNEFRQRLRGATRRMMATVSELSLYQATALRLAAHKAQLEEALAAAAGRLEQGLPPTQEAELEWASLVRQEQVLSDLRRERQEVAAILDAKGAATTTTAEPRPNAYIPQDLGIPRPYGAFGLFKPSAAGASMRHVRKPAPREVVV